MIYIEPIIKIIENIIWRFIELDLFQEFLGKVLVVVSGLFEKNEKNKKNLQLFNNNYVSATDPINEEEEKEIIHSQKNALIIELICLILEMKSLEVNDQYEPILVELFQKFLKKTHKEHKGLLKLLSILGEPKEILKMHKSTISEHDKFSDDPKHFHSRIKHKLTSTKDTKEINEETNDQEDEEQNENSEKKHHKKDKHKKKQMKKLEKKTSNISLAAYENEFLIEENQPKPKKFKNNSEFLIIENQSYQDKTKDDESLNEEEINIMKKYGLSLKKRKNELKPLVRSSLNDLRQEQKIKKDKKALVQQLMIVKENPKKIFNQPKKNISLISQKPEDYLENFLENQNFEVCDIENNEQKDLESIEIIKKKHEHFFKLVFGKYANSTNQGKAQGFRPSDEILQVLSMSDLRKMCKDFELDAFVKKEISEYIFMKINTNILGESRKKPLNYESFINYLIHISKFIFMKPPFDMSDSPLGILLEELINLMWKLAVQKNNKQILLLFSNKNKQNIRIQILNNILKEDPDSELPDVKFCLYFNNNIIFF